MQPMTADEMRQLMATLLTEWDATIAALVAAGMSQEQATAATGDQFDQFFNRIVVPQCAL
jgi:hypothetical protein